MLVCSVVEVCVLGLGLGCRSVVVTRCLATLVSPSDDATMRSECDEQRSGTANPGQTTLTRYCQQPQQRQQPEAAEPAEAQPENEQMLMLITKFTKTSHTHTTLLSLSLALYLCICRAALCQQHPRASER